MTDQSLLPLIVALGLSATSVAACGVERDTEERVEDRAEELVEDQIESDEENQD